MAFMYVTTTNDSAVGSGTHSIPVLEPNRRSLIKGNVPPATRLIEEEFNNSLSLDDITEIRVEVSEDTDEDEPETVTIYRRK